MGEAGKPRAGLIVSMVNLVFGLWAIAGGVYFSRLDWLVGTTLITVGLFTLTGIGLRSTGKFSALLCAGLSFGMAIAVIANSAPTNDVYAWLLLACGIACIMRWGLHILEPHVVP